MSDVILSEQTLQFTLNDVFGLYYWYSTETLFELVAGEKYTVTWDGTEYEYTAKEMSLGELSGIGLGNEGIVGIGENSGSPFIFAYIPEYSQNAAFSTDTEPTSHTVSIVKAIETPEAPETIGTDIVLYDRTGAAVTYRGIDSITTDMPNTTDKATFTHGVLLEGAEIPLDMSAGDQQLKAPSGYLLRNATIKKPETLAPQNIKKGVDVAGVIGEFAGEETEKTVALDMSDGDQVIEADTDTVMKKVTVTKPETLVSENIADGVDIGGVVGTMTDTGVDIINGTVENLYSPNVLSIRNYLFQSCIDLSTVDFPNCNMLGYSAFAQCTNLTTINFPSCISIGTGAFLGCSNLLSADFPECTRISASTFWGCVNLKDCSFPKCTSIEANAFDRCSSLKSAIFSNCTNISGYAFRSCYQLSTISFPKCINIGGDGFAYCSALKEADFPVCTAISSRTFYGCTNLMEANLPMCTEIPTRAFENCSSLLDIKIPSCSYIASYAFNSCSSLSEISCPLCTVISSYAFSNCTNLSSVSFPKCTTIGSAGFTKCYHLETAYFESCRLVYNFAFQSCSNLKVVSLPLCSSLYASAFANCSYLTSVYLLGSSIARMAYSNVFAGASAFSIFVRVSLLTSYKASTNWSYFASRFVGLTDEEIAALDSAQEETT